MLEHVTGAGRPEPRVLPVFTTSAGEAEAMVTYRALLDLWPVPYTEIEVPTSFGTTHVIASGPAGGPPVILLHALFATATSWYRTVGAMSVRHRTYAVDLLGDPNPSRPIRPITSEADYVQWFTELVDGLGVGRFDLVGNSVGGFVAAACAMQLGDRVRRLVLVSPAATFHPMPAFYVHMFAPKLVFLALPWLPGRARAMRRAVEWMRAGLPSDGPWDELFQRVLLHGQGTNRVFPRVYRKEELARIAAPTLLLVGDREKIYPVDSVVRDAIALLPGIDVQIVPGAHHIASVAEPDGVSARILAFLEGGPSSVAQGESSFLDIVV